MTENFVLAHGNVSVRVVRVRDHKKLEQLVLGNRSWLKPWEATNPEGPNSFDIKAQIKGLRLQMKNQQGLPLVICLEGQIVGQLNVSNILFGSVGSAVLGYWISPDAAGQSVTPTAVALTVDYLFNSVGLHRVEIDIRPENAASLRIVEKLGFRFEGLKERFIHINGSWRDHYVFAITREEVPGGVLERFANGAVPEVFYPYKKA